MTRNPNLGLYAIAIAIAVVGALWLGVPVGTLVLLAVVLACPLMMIFMMSGMHGGNDHDGSAHRHADDRDDHGSASHH
jgi:hypothetical protein